MTRTAILSALRNAQAAGYTSEALAVDHAVILLEQLGETSPDLRREVQNVWDLQFKVYGPW